MKPGTYRCRRAVTASDIRRAQAVRCEVFGTECGYLDPSARSAGYEQDPWDLHPEAVHFLLERDRACVGAARLVFGRLRSGCPGLGYGVPMETQFDLMPLSSTSTCVAEVGRMCIREDHRGHGTAPLVYGALARECLRRNATSLIGCANCEVDTRDGALELEQIITDLGLWSDTIFQPRVPAQDDPMHLPSLKTSDLATLPPVLRSYVAWGRVTFAGRPIFDRKFGRFAIAFLCDPRVLMRLAGNGP